MQGTLSDPFSSFVTQGYTIYIVWYESNLWYSGLTYYVGAEPLIVRKDSDTYYATPAATYPMFNFQSFSMTLIDTTSASYTGTVAPSFFSYINSSAFLVEVETSVVADVGYYRLQPEGTIYDNTYVCSNLIFVAKGEMAITVFTIEP